MLSKYLSNNMNKRLTSSLIILISTLVSLFVSKIFLILYLGIIFLCMIYEWYSITAKSIFDLFLGYIVIFAAILSLFIISFFKAGNFVLFWLFVTIWSYDSFALLGGQYIGGKKLAVTISPNKTFSGAISGILGTSIIVYLLGIFFLENILSKYSIFSVGILLPTIIFCILAQAGDLLESFYKRKYNVKNSGDLIPGHGGFLDRYDSFLVAAPILLILLLL